MLVRKIGAPFSSELAVGSVGDSEETYVARFAKIAGADNAYFHSEALCQLTVLRRRGKQY